MNKKYLIFGFLSFILLVLIFYKISYALFSSAASNNGNVISASTAFPTATPTVTPTASPTPTITLADHLVINEVLYDPSLAQDINNDIHIGEFVEIYNPTNSSQDLTSWTVEDNGGSSFAESLSGTLASHQYLILTGASESDFRAKWPSVPTGTLFILASGGNIGNNLANGGDRVILKNNGTEIDKMSWESDNSGFSSGCGLTCPGAGTGQSLERSPAGFDTNAAGDFVVRDPPTPGT